MEARPYAPEVRLLDWKSASLFFNRQSLRPTALREVEVLCARGRSPTTITTIPLSENELELSAALPATFGRGALIGSPPLSARGALS